MITKMLYRIFRPIFWLHEALHLLAARLMGIQARLAANYEMVIFDDLSAHPPLHAALVLLAPALVGVLMVAAAAWGWNISAQGGLSLRGHLNWLCGVWIGFGWLGGCVDDIWQVWHYWRCHQWRERKSYHD